MAELTYTVTVASGNLYGGGTGNVYYLDGARNSTGPGTISWVNGGTLRFEQSNASNDNHPLIFSTTTSKDQYLTSGVTYYLDGASNYAAYVNTTSFNAATTRYVEVTPSSETDFYYLCYIHGIGMGGVMDITQNTWGALGWNQNSWGTVQNNVTTTGLNTTSSIGNIAFYFSEGWGGGPDGWGAGLWGNINDHNEILTGQQLTTTVAPLTYAASEQGWGRREWDSAAWGITGSVIINTPTIASAINSVLIDANIEEGWGGDTYGENSWGKLDAETATPQGVQASTGIGSVTTTEEVNKGWGGLAWGATTWGASGDVIASGQSMTSAIGSVTAEGLIEIGWGRGSWGNRAWGDTFSALLVGQSITSAIGTSIAGTDFVAEVTGQQLNFATIGTYSIKIDSDVSIIEQGERLMDMSLGTIIPKNTTFEDVTGQAMSMTVGQAVGGTKIDVPVTGMTLGSATTSVPVVVTGDANTGTLIGQLLVSNTGTVDAVSVAEATGSQAIISAGQVTNTGTANVLVTGIDLTTAIASPTIYAWNEIDPNVNNVWTEVDLAA